MAFRFGRLVATISSPPAPRLVAGNRLAETVRLGPSHRLVLKKVGGSGLPVPRDAKLGGAQAGLKIPGLALRALSDHVAAQASDEGNILICQPVEPVLADKLPVCEQEANARFAKSCDDALHQVNACRRAGVPACRCAGVPVCWNCPPSPVASTSAECGDAASTRPEPAC